MKLKEYLKLRGNNALTNAEARAIGVSLKKGWPKRHAELHVPDEFVEKVHLPKLERKRAVKAIKVFKKPAAPKKEKPLKKLYNRPSQNGFLSSYEWRQVRYAAIKTSNGKCQACGASPSNGAILNVDHIKPRRTHPHLALDVKNLQVLCHECNHGKGNWDQTDWRVSHLDKEFERHMAND
jgi:5-methylcytosine-specific restriction endonuclease McrA